MGTVTIKRARLEQWLKAVDMFAGKDRQKALHEAGEEMLQALAARPVAWSDAKQSELNDWFLSLPTGRQVVLLEDKWMLAGAAFLAGKTTAAQRQWDYDTLYAAWHAVGADVAGLKWETFVAKLKAA
jgi:hypothetical protein